jgi:hypothetical protein
LAQIHENIMHRGGILIFLIGFVALVCGCETISQDVKGLAKSLKPVTPPEAGRMMIDQYDANKRREGTILISNAPFGGAPPYLANYRDMVDHESDPIVKAVAIRALARHGEPADALRITPHLSHENFQVRWEAAKGLQRLHNPAVAGDLIRVLLDESEQADVRIAAAIALGQYPEDRVFHGLLSALDERELAVNAAAERSLNLLTSQSFDMDSLRWLNWYNSVGSSAAFSRQQEYLYPTYWRDETIWEKLAFWTSLNFEKPAPPAGLRPKSERSTYP